MPTLTAPDFSLHTTLTSGQTFRWKEHAGWFVGVMGASVVKIRQDGETLQYESSERELSPNRLAHYFALDHDLNRIRRSIDVDWQIHQAMSHHRGLRILRQDGWEALASFICASFNNIVRIEGMIERLCQAYGDPIELPGVRRFTFPSPERVASTSERRLRSVGLGYRAPYLKHTARLVAERRLLLDELQQTDYTMTKRALLCCDGVGEKVADCVALFGFAKYEAFPIDVWMERVMGYYFRHRRMTRRRLQTYALAHFGPYAGYAQQYLYHYVRNIRRVNREKIFCPSS